MFIDGWRSFENGKYVDPMKINVLSVEGVYKRGDHIVVLIGTGAVYAKGTMEICA